MLLPKIKKLQVLSN